MKSLRALYLCITLVAVCFMGMPNTFGQTDEDDDSGGFAKSELFSGYQNVTMDAQTIAVTSGYTVENGYYYDYVIAENQIAQKEASATFYPGCLEAIYLLSSPDYLRSMGFVEMNLPDKRTDRPQMARLCFYKQSRAEMGCLG